MSDRISHKISGKILVAAAAGAMLLTAPALAANAAKPPAHAHAQPMKSTKTTSAKPMHHRHAKKVSMNMSTRGDREVRALNALESAGYRQFDNLHRKGGEFVATAMKSGRSYDVTITPAGQIQAARA